MIFDNTLMIADALAHDGTPTAIDLGRAGVGPGEPIRISITGSSTLAGCTGVVLTDDATGDADEALLTLTTTLAGKTVEVILPASVNRYLTANLVGTTTAGTWTCGVVPEGAQTNL